MIYFDNSATTYPKPPSVVRAVEAGVTKYGGNPGRSGHTVSQQVSEMVYETREKLGEMFDAAPERVMFTQNCTMSLNIAIGSIPDGSDVLTTDLEHNAVIRPLEAAKRSGRLRYRILPTGKDDRALLAKLDAMLRPDTKAVVMTAASNVTGRLLPIREVGEYCRKNGLLFIVDAAQAAGVMPFSIKQDHIDLLCMSGHKSLYGITGTGVLIASGQIDPKPLVFGGTGTESLLLTQPTLPPESVEAGTIPTVGICALSAGVDHIKKQGMKSMTLHNLALCEKLYRALLCMPQIRLYSPYPSYGNAVPTVAFCVMGESSEITAAKLNDRGFALRGGYQCAAVTHRKLRTLDSGVVRFSPGCMNTEKEVEALIIAIREIL